VVADNQDAGSRLSSRPGIVLFRGANKGATAAGAAHREKGRVLRAAEGLRGVRRDAPVTDGRRHEEGAMWDGGGGRRDKELGALGEARAERITRAVERGRAAGGENALRERLGRVWGVLRGVARRGSGRPE